MPRPALKAGEIRIRTRACGLNFADLLMIEGKYQDTPQTPFTLGMEVAGEVLEIGPGVTGFAPGDRVAGFPGQGGLAPEVCVAASRCLPLPANMAYDTAAAFQVAYGTSHLALDHKARLQPGETLFVTGAAGGVGLTAVEIGKRMGARIIASARGADKLEIARAAGADHLIDSDSPDLRGQLKALGGIDVMYDSVGGPGFLEALRATRPEGRLLAIGFAGGEVPQVPANLLLVKNLSVMGLYWGGYLAFRPEVLTASLQTLAAWIAEGHLRPHIGARFPLDRAAEALEMLRARKSTGKIVVTVD
ncbi:MAG: NADPH:quinone oxidoreductase family protein [Gemmobacter sp.]|uniref:NADPH:quinone oxidoreductase family protein n=1 Tax=Gemmobacter sp. TaxID=1898957 RepID=UPI001A5A2E87|nr:NADPH:quinone oxidoreductase family protein [Gemmobacter sp.]MBL8563185.1 NADPH:quinone oxidoreductase family protein [Gemmobacter sp.]